MRNILYIKEVKGRVILDSKTGNTQPLENVRIDLHFVEEADKRIIRGHTQDVSVIEKELIFTTKTNKHGEYKFYVPEGRYLVSLDTNTLPEGKGVVKPEFLINPVTAGNNDFTVRDIASIELNLSPNRSIFSTSSIPLTPILKDSRGEVLVGKVKCVFDNDEVEHYTNGFRFKPSLIEDKTVNLNVSAGTVSGRFPFNFKIPDVSSVDKIRLASECNMIDEQTRILFYLHSLFDQERLPTKFMSKQPIKSATTAMKEIQSYIRKKHADSTIVELAKQRIDSSIPSLDKTYVSPSGYFRIHYTTTGTNAVEAYGSNDVPTYIRFIGNTFDEVKVFTCATRGFREPILDKDNDCFDVYVYDLKGKYGVTTSLTYNRATKYKAGTASCYISVDNNFSTSKGFQDSRENCLKVTAAHEFFHAVQYAYNVDADNWWMEASATWNEDEMYTGVNDYLRYIGSFFSHPERSLEQSSYSGVVFAKYLSENMDGHKIIKRIWDVQSSLHRNSINAINKAISENNPKEDIGTIYSKFSAYNFNPAQYYREGNLIASTLCKCVFYHQCTKPLIL